MFNQTNVMIKPDVPHSRKSHRLNCRNANPYTVSLITEHDKIKYAAQVWALLQATYASVLGGLHYASINELIKITTLWKVRLVEDHVIAVVICKQNKGLKISAFAVRKKYGRVAKQALIHLMDESLIHCWIEVSEEAERFLMKNCNGADYAIPNKHAEALLKCPVILTGDGMHYIRPVNGFDKTKIILGQPEYLESIN